MNPDSSNPQGRRVLSGTEFNAWSSRKGYSLIKYIHDEDFTGPQREHYDFHYRLGLNVPETVDLDPLNPCSAGGLYFTYLGSSYWAPGYIFKVEVPDDAQVMIAARNKFKASALVISKPDEELSMQVIRDDSPPSLHRLPRSCRTPAVCLDAIRRASWCEKPTVLLSIPEGVYSYDLMVGIEDVRNRVIGSTCRPWFEPATEMDKMLHARATHPILSSVLPTRLQEKWWLEGRWW